ncbi:hypothetical protein EFD55_24755 [Rhizobium pisi]|uniref:Uncharacterized protein n=1 Tax=Rhizobium pisi TaxID=574561 RepID=A0A3R9ACE7_9HYPH|nr:hypothetical protein EFD55_24755 [Rhizobium pisi]TCA49738.1 hypothetical protein E0J16_23525 [Rhizobium pisi]
MILHALRLLQKFAPARRSREHSLFREPEDARIVYGETGEVAMNDVHANIHFLPPSRASGRLPAGIV